MLSRYTTLFILWILLSSITTAKQSHILFSKNPPLTEEWNPSSQELLKEIKISTRHKLDSIRLQIDKMTKAATRNGVVKFRPKRKKIVDELIFRAAELDSALAEIKEMEESKVFTFSLDESLDTVVSQKIPHKDSLTFILITVRKKDTAHALHEIRHAYQKLKGDVIFIVANGQVVQRVGNSITSNIDLELAGYKRQYAYSGYLAGWQTPPPESQLWHVNRFGKGIIEQVNTKYYITNHKQITPEFVKSLQNRELGNDPVYQ